MKLFLGIKSLFSYQLKVLTISWPLSVSIVLHADSQLASVGVEAGHVLRDWRGPRGGQAKLVISRHTKRLSVHNADVHEYWIYL